MQKDTSLSPFTSIGTIAVSPTVSFNSHLKADTDIARAPITPFDFAQPVFLFIRLKKLNNLHSHSSFPYFVLLPFSIIHHFLRNLLNHIDKQSIYCSHPASTSYSFVPPEQRSIFLTDKSAIRDRITSHVQILIIEKKPSPCFPQSAA